MKTLVFILLVLWIGTIGFMYTHISTYPRVDVPEEYQLMTPDDIIKGYYDRQGILHIYYVKGHKIEIDTSNDSLVIGDHFEISGMKGNVIRLNQLP